ncbi:hypothetical protein RS030_192992 [Cryptosporidium xiaoi]|uniref:Uncharacterized protein n=1 Tax=Cryptosporidium xiaoi TaxID=659607 RepID=A0AAV9XZ63_9CRYT
MKSEISKISFKSEQDLSVLPIKAVYGISDEYDSKLNAKLYYLNTKIYNEGCEYESDIVSSKSEMSKILSNKENKNQIRINTKSSTENGNKFSAKPKNSINNQLSYQSLFTKENYHKIRKKVTKISTKAKSDKIITRKKISFCSCTRPNVIDDYNCIQFNAVENKPNHIKIRNEENTESSIERNEICSQIDNYFIDEIRQITPESKSDKEDTNSNAPDYNIENSKSADIDHLEDEYPRIYSESMDLWFLSRKLAEIQVASKIDKPKDKPSENIPISQIILRTLDWYETYKAKTINDLSKKLH